MRGRVGGSGGLQQQQQEQQQQQHLGREHFWWDGGVVVQDFGHATQKNIIRDHFPVPSTAHFINHLHTCYPQLPYTSVTAD